MIDGIELATTTGTRIRLSSYAGKPCLLIVEGLASLNQNDAFKKELREKAKANPELASQVNLIAVADLASIQDPIGMKVATTAIAAAQQQEPGVTILIDRLGEVNARFSTSASKSNIFVLTSSLKPILGLQGSLTPVQIETVFARLQSQLRQLGG